ncbi:MAG: sulfite exporter TauE/SafE family protein [Phycisphaeraceae bacterium]
MMDQWLSVGSVMAIALIGLVSGLLGGMLGVGGSVVMIPAMTLVFGFNQHLYQAAAMVMNVAVSLPAVLRHRRAGALVPGALRWMLPAALACVLVGVWLSNLPVFAGAEGGLWLGRLLALFLVYVIVLNVMRLVRPGAGEAMAGARVTPVRSGAIGGVMGTIAGLLGIGGGAVAVPMQQVVMRLPLRNAIANSAAIICISAGVGAIYKNATLARHVGVDDGAAGAGGVGWQTSLLLAALLAPTAWAGGRAGASLTHRLPIRQVRLAFVGLMVVAAWRMAALPWPAF